MGHFAMGHFAMGHFEMGHFEMGHFEMGHLSFGAFCHVILWAQEPTIFPQVLPLGSVSFCLQKALLSCTKARLL